MAARVTDGQTFFVAANVRTAVVGKKELVILASVAWAVCSTAALLRAQVVDSWSLEPRSIAHSELSSASRVSVLEKIPERSTPGQASIIFRRNFVRLRAEQRAALAEAAREMAAEVEALRSASPPASAAATEAGEKVVFTLRGASDMQTALDLVLRLRSSLDDRLKPRVSMLVDRFAELLNEASEAKQDYQFHLAKVLRRQWNERSIDEKRALLAEYLSLSQEVPGWLLRQRSELSPLPLTPAAEQLFGRFESQARSDLRATEKHFEPPRNKLAEELHNAAQNSGLSNEQSQAVNSLLSLLEADYGKGFRGLMLCECAPELPPAVRDRVAEFYAQYRASLAQLRQRRAFQLAELEGQLSIQRAEHLKQREFAELMAIDLRFDELIPPTRPLWIYAFRPPRVARPESALLLDVRDDQYRIRFAIDGYETWLSRTDVILRARADAPVAEFEVDPPDDGPGTAIGKNSHVENGTEVYVYRNKTWQPVTVVDVSPFGLVVHWEGHSKESDQIVPRHHLRRHP